jgi:hypothetical protein
VDGSGQWYTGDGDESVLVSASANASPVSGLKWYLSSNKPRFGAVLCLRVECEDTSELYVIRPWMSKRGERNI